MNSQVSALREAVLTESSQHGDTRLIAMQKATSLIVLWLGHLLSAETTGTAEALLHGARAAIVEATGCVILGVARPALFSMRAQIDMVLAWLFFKDHAVEWSKVDATSDGFKMKKDLLTYFQQHYPMYQERYKLLSDAKIRTIEDPYRFLSAHVHSQNSFVVPEYRDLASVVSNKEANECLAIQEQVSEYLNDILLALYGDKWASLPAECQGQLRSRLNDRQRAQFFAIST